MKYRNILVTGGAGFVGSNICVKLKNYYSDIKVLALDNLIRKGSELNIPRLSKNGIKFIKGDVRNKKDLNSLKFDLIIECSAEPSVLAGINSSPEYVLDTNLFGAVNCFESARKNNSDVVFLSTSRVYPIKPLNNLRFKEEETRFSLLKDQKTQGVSLEGISEEFPIEGIRSLYGATKLSSEFILQEYIQNYGIKGVINRCGLIAGPWQMGKIDQGVITFFLSHYVFEKPLKFIGFGGKGKQVRDVINVDDLFDLINIQISNLNQFNGKVFNIGGGKKNSLSLLELANYCQKLTKNKILIGKDENNRPSDIRIYVTDNKKIKRDAKWSSQKSKEQTLEEIYKWILENKKNLESILI